MLISAPNLHDISIASDLDSSNLPLHQEQGEPRMLHLRSLELYGCRFNNLQLPVAWHVLERLSLDGPSLGGLSVCPSFGLDFAGLKSLRLRNGISGDRILLGVVLNACKKLEVLDLTGFINDIQPIDDDFWGNAGKTLIKLRLHEEVSPDGERALLSMASMGRVAKHCRNLRSLGIDLQCDGQQWVSLNSNVVPSNIKPAVSIALYDASVCCGYFLVPCPSGVQYLDRKSSTRPSHFPQSDPRQRFGGMEIHVA